MVEILKELQGGDLRSIGKVDYVVTTILSDHSLFPDVFDGMSNSDPIIRMRAADAVEKITRNNPALLFPFKKKLLEEVSQIEQQEVRWHLAQMFSRLELDENELGRVVYLLNRFLRRNGAGGGVQHSHSC